MHSRGLGMVFLYTQAVATVSRRGRHQALNAKNLVCGGNIPIVGSCPYRPNIISVCVQMYVHTYLHMPYLHD